MKSNIVENILKDLLTFYLGLSDYTVEKYLKEPSLGTKERVETIDDLQVIIYSNDHNPPHFHVKSKNLKIDARFRIEDCQLMSGDISAKDLKKIKAFYSGPKGKAVMELIWKKKASH